jgi:hypothetical protein
MWTKPSRMDREGPSLGRPGTKLRPVTPRSLPSLGPSGLHGHPFTSRAP